MIKIKIHTAQFVEEDRIDQDEVKILEFETAEAANAYIDNQITEIDQKWRDTWNGYATISQDISYIECEIYCDPNGESRVYEIFEILEIAGVKVRYR